MPCALGCTVAAPISGLTHSAWTGWQISSKYGISASVESADSGEIRVDNFSRKAVFNVC
jgi:hypothetical protein